MCEQRGTCPTWSWRPPENCSSCHDHCALLPLAWWPLGLPPCWPHSLRLDLCTGCSFCCFRVGSYKPVNCHPDLFVAGSWPCAHSTEGLTSKLNWKPNQIRVPPRSCSSPAREKSPSSQSHTYASHMPWGLAKDCRPQGMGQGCG